MKNPQAKNNENNSTQNSNEKVDKDPNDTQPNNIEPNKAELDDKKSLADSVIENELVENEQTENELTDNEAIANETVEKTVLPSQIKLTGRLLNFTRLSLQGNQLEELLEKVKTKLGKSHQSNLPVVISCSDELDLAQLWQGLWELGLQPIGIVTGVLDEQAKAQHIAIFPSDGERLDGKNTKTKPKSEDNPTATLAAENTDSELPNNPDKNVTDKLVVDNGQVSHLEGDLIHHQILRSGQSINHVGGDVILTQGINAGAEAITDYSLHVYGKAEGRLVAGATGDKNAKIFCLKFNPSLVSVAGTYCLKENIPAEFINQAVQVSYQDGQGLVFRLMA